MSRQKEDDSMLMSLSVRLEKKHHEMFRKLAHLEFTQMGTIARKLILEWMEKRKHKLDKL